MGDSWGDPRRSLLIAPGGDVRLERLDDAGADWYAEGPRGDAMGDLAVALAAVVAPAADADWQDAVGRAMLADVEEGMHRPWLFVKRGDGTMLHVTRSTNRESIDEHGLDWRRMGTKGIAGSVRREYPGIYVCGSREDADFFAGMVREGTADIWSVDTTGLWLEGAHDADSGSSEHWMIVPAPIERARIALVARDLGRPDA
jgi:hypothetical protein